MGFLVLFWVFFFVCFRPSSQIDQGIRIKLKKLPNQSFKNLLSLVGLVRSILSQGLSALFLYLQLIKYFFSLVFL